MSTPSSEPSLARTALDPSTDERFVMLRRALGVSGFGLNQMRMAPGQRGRVHDHRRQEEVYLVWQGTLTLIVEGVAHDLGPGELARVGPGTRRQLVNRGRELCLVVALGGDPGSHEGRDGLAWTSWEDTAPPRSPREVPLPDDLTPDELGR
jgi:uncharacterized cupin superfamily protein